ncbi:GNAT family N-acetyltransferase [Sorangium sp. So ce134]
MVEIEPVHEDLVQAGALAPVALGGPEEQRWIDCELASLAENRLGDPTDPEAIDEARRADWEARATDQRVSSLRARGPYERGYWILEHGERVGTLALATSTLGARRLGLASFYVYPRCRGRGAGRRALRAVQEAAARRGIGVRLSTSWCWQRAVRFYLASGMWIAMWKRDLTFCSDASTPSPRIDVGAAEASLSVPVGDGSVVLARARRRGDRLELDQPPEDLAKNKQIGEAYWHATSTLALALALHGWPLIRSQEAWDRGHYADAGPPESLAYKITIWEAWAAKHGWAVDTPRIPGLQYPSWDELEARWEAEREEIEASVIRKA